MGAQQATPPRVQRGIAREGVTNQEHIGFGWIQGAVGLVSQFGLGEGDAIFQYKVLHHKAVATVIHGAVFILHFAGVGGAQTRSGVEVALSVIGGNHAGIRKGGTMETTSYNARDGILEVIVVKPPRRGWPLGCLRHSLKNEC